MEEKKENSKESETQKRQSIPLLDEEVDSSALINAYSEDGSEQNEITINDKVRSSLFILLCIEYCISSSDGGIVPQQNKNLQKDFHDDGDSKVGLFGSIDYIGRILGALVMSVLINRLDRKLFMSGCCLIKGILLVISLFTGNYAINLLTRLLTGIPQTLLTSYGTLWTDQFGKKSKRTMMLPILQFSSLLGIMVGYGLGIICNGILGDSSFRGWRLSFVVEGVGLGVIGIIILFYPKIYFSQTFYLNEDDDFKGKEKSLKEIEIEKKKNKENSGWKIFWEQFPKILCIKIYLFMTLSNTVAFFGMRVIQFYADKYMEEVLEIKEKLKFILYIILCMTGPVIGILICGIICSKIGGYASKNGMIFILLLNILACIASLLITATLNPVLSLGACWLYLFCYAAVTPLQGGVIISSLPKSLKGNGFSINMFLLNGLGSFPSSYVYGIIADYIQDHYPEEKQMRYRAAMMITMYYNYVGLILAGIAGILRLKLKRELGDYGSEELEEEIKKNEETDFY